MQIKEGIGFRLFTALISAASGSSDITEGLDSLIIEGLAASPPLEWERREVTIAAIHLRQGIDAAKNGHPFEWPKKEKRTDCPSHWTPEMVNEITRRAIWHDTEFFQKLGRALDPNKGRKPKLDTIDLQLLVNWDRIIGGRWEGKAPGLKHWSDRAVCDFLQQTFPDEWGNNGVKAYKSKRERISLLPEDPQIVRGIVLGKGDDFKLDTDPSANWTRAGVS